MNDRDARPTELLANTAPGVTYTTIADAPGLRFFRCALHRATVSTKSCADRWRQGQKAVGAEGDRFEKCRACAIGSAHAGESYQYRSPLFGMQIDPRTRRWTSRLIFGRWGVSSYNRNLEYQKQLNAKQKPPLFRLDARRIAVILDGRERIELHDPLTADSVEMAVAVLRVAVGRVAFTRAKPSAPAITTIELAKRFQSKPKPIDKAARERVKRRVERRRREIAEALAVAAE
jgi:hypothetical protein